MNKLNLMVALAALLLIAADAKDDAVKAELKRMEGAWRAVSIIVDGTELLKEDVENSLMTFKADGTWRFKGKNADEDGGGTFTVDPTKSPKTSDFVATEGNDKGSRSLDIYELDGDTMKVCYVEFDPAKGEAKERPTKFASEKGSGHVLVVAKRVRAN